MGEDSPRVVWLGNDADEREVGGKAHSLTVLRQHGLSVPPGFVLPVRMFPTRFSSRETLSSQGPLDSATADNPEFEWPAQLLLTLSSSYNELSRLVDSDLVAVRSSAPGEDSLAASYAGQYRSVLNVSGLPAVLDAVVKCWESFSSPRVGAYRQALNLPKPTGMAVIIQEMLPPDVAGVLFTRHPLTKGALFIIEAASGLAESVVSGRVIPQRLIVDPYTMRILEHNLSNSEGVLSAEDIESLVAAGRQIERLFSRPQDIEWAKCGNELYFLQSRPLSS